MFPSKLRPQWWQVYLTLPLLVVLFIAESRLKLSVRGHQAVQIGIVLLIYGLIHLWLKANSSALSNMDQKRVHRRFMVHQIPGSRWKLPDPERKGGLSDTSEMDIIDAEFLPMDGVPEELKKE